MTKARHPIKVVARLTGLSAHVIRIWEQRYNAVRPERTATNRRLYSRPDIERLNLLREVSQNGHKISLIARLSTEKLRKLAVEFSGSRPASPLAEGALPTHVDALLAESLAAIKALDARGLDDALRRGVTLLGTVGLLQRVVAPLTGLVGEMWIKGAITVAHEHLATSVLRTFLGNAAKYFGETRTAPLLVVATPAGQLHELGALLVGAMAAHLGWQVIYLGASLPAAEIAGAALQSGARAVALSLVYPEDDPRMAHELAHLRELLAPGVAVLAGGRAVAAYAADVRHINAVQVSDLAALGVILEELRRPSANRAPVATSGGPLK